jgi:glycosyltransferase involved in cell wall biosynthesis
MTIGYHAPEPGAQTGVADYAAQLAAELGRHAQVLWNRPGDTNLYHLGNNRLHAEIYRRALAEPGVALLHDAVLHHLLLGLLDEREYVSEFVYNYGEWTRGLAGELWRNRGQAASGPQFFAYGMLRRVCEASRAVIVHNPGAARRVREHAPGAKVIEIPHLAPAPPPAGDRDELRRSLGLPPRALVAGVFGHLREAKRVPGAYRAAARARARGAQVLLVVAGETGSAEYARALEPLLAADFVRRVGYLDEACFWRWARAVDVCVNLRYPAAGETSGIGVRMMAAGTPVIFTAGEEVSRIPPDAALRVGAGPEETDHLADLLAWLAKDSRARRRLGERAAQYAKEELDAGRIGEKFCEALKTAAGPAARPAPCRSG